MSNVAVSLREKVMKVAQGPTDYERLVTQALGLRRELQALSGEPLTNHHAALRSSEKLSAEAFLAHALRLAKAGTEKVLALREAIDADPSAYPHLIAFVAETTRRVISVRHDEGALTEPPASNHAALLPESASREDFLHCIVEALKAESSMAIAVALAVLEATKRAPRSAFGTAEHLGEQRAQQEKLQQQLQELCGKIPDVAETCWTWQNQSKSLAVVRYRWRGADSGVAVGPLEGSGQRLVEHLAAA